jgi:putative ABC transport system permease protein
MAWYRAVAARLRNLFTSGRAGRDFDREIELHLGMLAERFIGRGMSPEEAHYAARRQFGNAELLRQARREMDSFSSFEALLQDIRFGVRTLGRSPAFTAVAVLTIALGVGANTAIFSVVKAVLLDPLPYADAGRLITIAETATDAPENPTVDYTAVRELRESSRSFESLSAYRDGPGILFENGKPEMLRGLSVDHNFFGTLGVQMQFGRDFLPEEQQPGRRIALILSHGLWQRQFGGDPRVLGRVLLLSKFQVTVVGVLPPDFKPLLKAQSELDPEMYYPLSLDPFYPCRNCSAVHLIGRLKRGVAAGEASADLNGILRSLVRENPEAHLRGARIDLVPLPDRLLGRARTALWAVWCSALFILLIACANVANLLLARAVGRTREIAVRTAIGAGRGRLVRQLLTESLVLAFAGGLLGAGLAYCGTGTLASLAPGGIPRAQAAHVDAPVFVFALAATVIAGMLFGLVPAWRASRVDLNRAMKDADDSGHTHNGLRNGLAVAQIALAFVLAVGAGLMVRTFWRLTSVGAGFDPRNVLTLTTCVIGPRYAGDTIGYYRDVLERLRAIPGIEGAALTSLIPMDYTDRLQIHREDRPLPNEKDAPFAAQFSVSPDYFRVMRIPLKHGRLFSEQDAETSAPVALIGETCARAQFPGEDPIGKHIKLGERNSSAPWMTIVGVVGDVRQDGIDRPADMQVYMPLNQGAVSNYYRLMARTSGDPMRLERAVREAFEAVDAGSPVYHVKPLEGYVSGRLASRTFALALLGLFGALAVALAAVGIYGVISYSVARRTREVGIRIALGAARGDVVALVLRNALPLIGAGLVIGLVASLMLTHLLASLLFEVAPADPATSAAVAVMLASVALAAGAVPARRAATLDPTVALRRE